MESSKIDYTQFKFPKGKINKEDNKSCLKPILKANKPIRKRTAKQNKIEKQRFSILTTDFTKCYICGKPKNEIHELFRTEVIDKQV